MLPGASSTRRASERGSDAQTYDSSRRESFCVSYGPRTQHPGFAIVGILVDQQRREIDESTPIGREELRMVERVVEQRRELQPEMPLLHHILIEREVHDPRARPFQAAFLGVAEFSRRRNRIGSLIEEGIA